eukprot:5900250-Pleurochrysis_carterae.AAC.1
MLEHSIRWLPCQAPGHRRLQSCAALPFTCACSALWCFAFVALCAPAVDLPPQASRRGDRPRLHAAHL